MFVIRTVCITLRWGNAWEQVTVWPNWHLSLQTRPSQSYNGMVVSTCRRERVLQACHMSITPLIGYVCLPVMVEVETACFKLAVE